jgi:hypothetical protein
VRIAVVATIAALALVAAGCGGDDDGSGGGLAADEWAEQFCTAVASWRGELEEIGESVGDLSSVSLETLRSAATDASAATDRLVDEVGALGAPDLEAGDEIEAEVAELTDVLEQQRDQIEQTFDDPDASGAAALAAIGSSISTMGEAFEATLRDVRDADASGEISSAFEDTDACDDVTS